MKWQIAIALLMVGVVSCDERYTDRYDNLNTDEMLQNKALVKNYCKCVLDQGPCTADGKELKANLGDAFHNCCVKCTDKQKENAKKVIVHLTANEAKCWEDVRAKYDSKDFNVECIH